MSTTNLTAENFEPTVTRDGIGSIPTLMAFRDGILVFSQPGALPEAGLEQVIASVRDLDMDEVRAAVADRSAAAEA